MKELSSERPEAGARKRTGTMSWLSSSLTLIGALLVFAAYIVHRKAKGGSTDTTVFGLTEFDLVFLGNMLIVLGHLGRKFSRKT